MVLEMPVIRHKGFDKTKLILSFSVLCFSTTLPASADPKVVTSVFAGTIDVSDPPATLNPIHYAMPQYSSGSSYQYLYRGPGPCRPDEPVPSQPISIVVGEGPCLHLGIALSYGAAIVVDKAALLNVSFEITNWPLSLPVNWPYSVTIVLGNQTRNIGFGKTHVEFQSVMGTRVPLAVTVNGALSISGRPAPMLIPGVLPLVITRQ